MISARTLSVSSYGWFCAAAALLVFVSSSCVIEVNTDPRSAPLTEEEIEQEQFNGIAEDFNDGAPVFASDVGQINAAGARLFWSSAGTQLHSYDVLSMKQFDYMVPVADDVSPAFVASETLVVTASKSDDALQISVFPVEKNAVIDAITWPAVKGAPNFNAIPRPPISIDQSDVYLLDAQNVLYRWSPGAGAPMALFSLADRGLSLSYVPRFSVHGDTMLVADEDADSPAAWAVWEIALSAGAAQKIESPAVDVCFQDGSAIYRTFEQTESSVTVSVRRYSSSDGSIENVSDALSKATVTVGGFTITSEQLQDIYFIDCQPRGFTFSNPFGLFYFNPDTSKASPLYLRVTPIDDGDEVMSTIAVAKVVEDIGFLRVDSCTVKGSDVSCPPSTLYRRDLPSP